MSWYPSRLFRSTAPGRNGFMCPLLGLIYGICRLDEILCRLDEMLCRLDEILCRLDEILCRLDEILCRLDEILCRLDEMLCRLDEILCRLDEMLCRLDEILETFRNATLTVTVRGARRLWRHRIVCIWNAPNRRPNRNCQHMTVSDADNRTRFTVSGYAKFHQIFREHDIDLLYFNKLLSKCITHL